MLRQVLAIITHDLRVFLADRSNLPGLLVTPVVMTVIIGLVSGGALGGSPGPVRLDVLDHDGSAASERLIETVDAAHSAMLICPLRGDAPEECGEVQGGATGREAALERVAEGDVIGLLEIPHGFGRRLEAGEATTLTLHSTGDFGPGQTAQRALSAAVQQINGAALAAELGVAALPELGTAPEADAVTQIHSQLYERALAIWLRQPVQVELVWSGAEEAELGGGLRQGLGHSVPGMGSMFVMMTVFGGMAKLIEERDQWTLQRLASMPLSRGALLAGKIGARFSLGLLQFLVVFAVGAVLGMNFGADPVALVLLALVYTLSVTALSFALGSRLSNQEQASGLALLLALTLAPLGGAWWPLEITPPLMQIAGHISPIAWAMDGFLALTYESARLADIWLPMVVLLAITAAAFAVAVPRLRYQLD